MTLTVTGPSNSVYGDELSMAARDASGTGSVSFAVTGDAASAIIFGGPVAGNLEITSGTGTCEITATKAADDNYNSISSTAFNVTVAKAAGSVSINNILGNAVFCGCFTPRTPCWAIAYRR